MTQLIELSDYMFPIREVDVAYDGIDNLSELNPNWMGASNYKAIVREDTNELISIVSQSYRVVSNAELIDRFMERLSELDTPYVLNQNHCFLTNQRMKIHVEFPELIFTDPESSYHLSLYLHNSYDGTVGVRIFWGAIRSICTNGMIIGKLLKKFYHRHTQGIELGNVADMVHRSAENLPIIQQKIQTLATLPVPVSMLENTEKLFGKKFMEQYERVTVLATQYALLNALTWHISHRVSASQQSRYQNEVARMFGM